ncbi:TPA: hypothetical protein ACH7TQ_003044 [Escherichia coli]
MSLLPIDPSQGEDFQMSSYEFLTKVINPARQEAGEKPVRNNVFIDRICDELGEGYKNLVARKVITAAGQEADEVMLDRRSLLLVGMRESKAVRRRVLDYIESQDLKLRAVLKQQAELAHVQVKTKGATWAEYCRTHGLPEHKLMDVLLKKGRYLFERNPITNEWAVAPNLQKYFTIIKMSNYRFSPSGINFRFNAVGFKHFSKPENVQKLRDIYDEYQSRRSSR